MRINSGNIKRLKNLYFQLKYMSSSEYIYYYDLQKNSEDEDTRLITKYEKN